MTARIVKQIVDDTNKEIDQQRYAVGQVVNIKKSTPLCGPRFEYMIWPLGKDSDDDNAYLVKSDEIEMIA